jgi:hypothetical protein
VKTVLAIFGAIFLLIIFGVFALCNDDDPDSFGPIQLISHEYDGGDCDWEGNCGGYDERNGGYGDDRGGDGRFGGGRSGDYDGGPGDDCRNACGNTIIIPDPRGGEEQR